MPITSGFTCKRDFNEAQRKTLAKSGAALPDGSFPIENASDLKHAISLMGMSKHPESEVKAHILARAKALGIEDQLPESWSAKKMGAFTSRGELTKKVKKFRGAQASPMDVAAMSAALTKANS